MSDTPIPSIKVVKKWKRANVVDFLKEKKEELELENEDIQIIDKNRVNGGPAKTITILIENIKGETREHEKKRKAKEELTITKPNKRRWEVNGVIEPSIVHSVYFVNPTEESRPLLEKIHEGQFVALHGARASGKSTRVHQIQKQLNNEGYVCIYVSLEQINIKSVDNFWETFGTQIHLDASKYIKLNSIKPANDFNIACCESHPTFPTSPKVEVPYYPSIARVLVNNANNQEVRESVYDAELYQIMSNWLDRFRVTGQWHLKYCASGHINNKYVDIVISRSDHPKIVFELLATATKKELKEHYERALIYDKKLPADETWIVHFTCEANAISEPCWPTKSQLQKGLRVIYFWHDLGFTKTRMISCW
nr:15002_t:CDS:2 [Entrophospora candida]